MDENYFQYYEQLLMEHFGYECCTGHIAEKHSEEGVYFDYIVVEKNVPYIKRISFRIEDSEFLDNEILICHFENGDIFEYGYNEPDEKENIIMGHGATEREAWEDAINGYQ